MPARPVVRVAWLPRGSQPAGSPVPERVTVVAMQGETKSVRWSGRADRRVVCLSRRRVEGDLHRATTRQRHHRSRRPQLDVPDLAGATLWMTSPLLFRAQNVREFRGLDRGPNALPYAGREFVRTDRLVIRFDVQGTAAAAAKVTARITSQWGKDLAELPLLPHDVCRRPIRDRVAAHLHRQRRLPDRDQCHVRQ